MARELPIHLTSRQCNGRTFAVTGANTGLGYETTKHLVSLGAARVIMAVRDMHSGDAAKEEIEKDTGRQGVLEVWHLDLAEYQSVEAFAKKADNELDRIDGLVANAGIANGSWCECEGNEQSITVNVIATLLLALLLIPKMEHTAGIEGAAPTITFLTSINAFHVQTSLNKVNRDMDILDDLNNRDKWELDIINRYEKEVFSPFYQLRN